MKYKYLTQEELQLLENELLQFLIANGIDGPEWEKINTTQPEKAIEIVGLFSDLVWQRSLEKVKFGEKIYDNQYLVFAFHQEDVEMLALSAKQNNLALNSFEDFTELLRTQPQQLNIRHHKKNYNTSREEEIFFMMNNGLLLSDHSRYELLLNLYNNA
jgi:hypothetical protein